MMSISNNSCINKSFHNSNCFKLLNKKRRLILLFIFSIIVFKGNRKKFIKHLIYCFQTAFTQFNIYNMINIGIMFNRFTVSRTGEWIGVIGVSLYLLLQNVNLCIT